MLALAVGVVNMRGDPKVVRFVPKPDILRCGKKSLFDDLVGARKKPRRYLEVESSSRRKIER